MAADLRSESHSMEGTSHTNSCKLYSGSVMRDANQRYDYMVECKRIPGGVVWFACVRHKGEYRGSPSGVLIEPLFERAALEGTVRGEVEDAIRQGRDVHIQ